LWNASVECAGSAAPAESTHDAEQEEPDPLEQHESQSVRDRNGTQEALPAEPPASGPGTAE
jgi:hypothetical protein